jgi:hypothetical protein
MELQPHRLAAKAHALHLRLGVLQSEIEMARLCRMKIRDFALDPQVRKLRGQRAADPGSQLGHAPDLPRGSQIQFELLYFLSHCTSHRTTVRATLRRIHVTTGK